MAYISIELVQMGQPITRVVRYNTDKILKHTLIRIYCEWLCLCISCSLSQLFFFVFFFIELENCFL